MYIYIYIFIIIIIYTYIHIYPQLLIVMLTVIFGGCFWTCLGALGEGLGNDVGKCWGYG